MAERMMSPEEKALLQAKHRLEEGAILESVLPAASTMNLDALRGYLEERFGA